MPDAAPSPIVPEPVPPLVLVIDDNDGDFVLLRESLKDGCLGQPLPIALELMPDLSTGQAIIDRVGCAAAYQARIRPDLIILDVNLPIMNGKEILVILKRNFPGIPVLMLSSSQRESEKAEALALGADAYLAKPMNIEEYEPLLKTVVEMVVK